MKKLLLVFMLLFSTFLYAEIDERKSDFYFVNGIDTTKKQAKDAKNKLKKQTELTNLKAYKQIKSWKVNYNHTRGFQADIYESAIQKLYKLVNEDGRFQAAGSIAYIFDATVGKIPGVKDIVKGVIGYVGKKVSKDVIKKILLDEAKSALRKKGLKLSKEDIAFLSEEIFDGLIDDLLAGLKDETINDINKDVTTHYNAYNKSIQEGHGVIIVSHSQGNFYTNFIIDAYQGSGHSLMADWQKPYINTFGVATPTSSVANGGSHITFDNDIIQSVPGHLGWNVKNPTRYKFTNAAGEKVETFFSKEAHSFLSSYMATFVTRNSILGFIDGAVTKHQTALSQYTPLPNCTKTKTLTHISSSSTIADIENVYVDYDTGKLYDDGTGYVKANGDDNITRNIIPPTVAADGIITVSLNWQNFNINLELNSEIGTKDISASKCNPLEHYYVASEDDILPGRYMVSIYNYGDVNASLLPHSISLNIHAMDSVAIFDFNITALDMLNIGDVAEIVVSEHKEPQISVKNNPTVTASKCYGSCEGVVSSGSYQKYLYSIQSKLKQALLGPLSNASISLSDAKEFESSLPLYESSTGGGRDILTSGVFYFPNTLLDTIHNNDYYILSVNGGEDIDSDDNGILDSSPTQNLGSLHTLISGDELKTKNFKASLLTEVAYQVTKELLNEELNTTLLREKLNDIANRLLAEDIDGDDKIDYEDLLVWTPRYDKDKLLKNYNENHQSIVENIYLNNDIYELCYKLVYDPLTTVPVIQNFSANIDEFSSAGTIVGQLDINSTLDSISEIRLSPARIRVWNATKNKYEFIPGSSSNNFNIDLDGVIRISNTAVLNYQTRKEYNLYVVANNSYGSSEIASVNIYINNLINSIEEPVYVYEHTDIQTLVATFDVEKYSDFNITDIVVLGEGKEDFNFTQEGNIYIAQDLDYERQQTYSLVVQVVGDGWTNEINASININGEDTINILSTYYTRAIDTAISKDKTKVYIAQGQNGTAEILDISDVLSPTQISYVDTGGITTNIAPHTNGSLMLVSDYYAGFRVYDINDTLNPQSLSSEHSLYTSSFMIPFKQKSQAYVITRENELNLLDFSNSNLVYIVSTQILESEISSISFNDEETIAYLSTNDGLKVYDCSDSSNIQLLSSLTDIGKISLIQLSTDEKKAYVFSDTDMYTIETNTLAMISQRKMSNSIKNITISDDGNTLYLADYVKGLQILDIKDPQNIKVITNFYLPTMHDIDLLNNTGKLILSSEDNGIFIVDIGDVFD